MARHSKRRAGFESGFTLLEIMAVIAILGLVSQLVVMNLGKLVPSTVLDSEASQLMGQVEYLRSEAQLQEIGRASCRERV